MTPQQQAEAMIQRINEKKIQSCKAIIDQARQQATEIVKQAYHEVIQQVKLVISDERARMNYYDQIQDARLWTVKQQLYNQQESQFLAKAMDLIKIKLVDIWHQDKSIWLKNIIPQALAIFSHDAWLVEHSEDFNEAEQHDFIMQVQQQRPEQSIHFKINTTIVAGIIIRQKHIVLDATLAGVLKDQIKVNSALLYLLEQEIAK